nr:hypothetical protein [Crucivirus sp.]
MFLERFVIIVYSDTMSVTSPFQVPGLSAIIAEYATDTKPFEMCMDEISMIAECFNSLLKRWDDLSFSWIAFAISNLREQKALGVRWKRHRDGRPTLILTL